MAEQWKTEVVFFLSLTWQVYYATRKCAAQGRIHTNLYVNKSIISRAMLQLTLVRVPASAKVLNNCLAKCPFCGILGVTPVANGLSVCQFKRPWGLFAGVFLLWKLAASCTHNRPLAVLLYCLILSRLNENCFWQTLKVVSLFVVTLPLYFYSTTSVQLDLQWV